MRFQLPFLVLLVGLPWACHGPRDPELSAAATPHQGELPASSLGGAVRALETLAAVRPTDSLTQVRALECDTRHDPGSRQSFVRVFLPLTVYAPTLERAEEAFAEIRAALEAEARAGERTVLASEGRARRVLGELDWDPPGHEDWVSFSDTIRLELTPGREAPAAPLDTGSTAQPPTASLESYVRRLAARPLHAIGQVEVTPKAADPAIGAASGVRCRIEPLGSGARYSRLQIAGFLGALEAESPAARLTRIEIQRSQDEPDVHAARGWTFEAELTLRATPPAEPSSPGALAPR